MVLGDVIGVEAGAVIGFDDLEAILVIIRQRRAGAVEMIEDAEFHFFGLIPANVARIARGL